MSHIIDFRIEGLAGRNEPFEWKLDRNVNVFFGRNGCGKTSLLKILHSAMDNNASMLARVPFTSATVTIHSLAWNQQFVRTLTKPPSAGIARSVEDRLEIERKDVVIRHIAFREAETLKWKTTPSQKGVSDTSWNNEYLPTSRLLILQGNVPPWSAQTAPDRPIRTEEQIDVYFEDSITRLWKDYTSRLLRTIRSAQEAGLVSILRTVLSPIRSGSRPGLEGLEPAQAYERMRRFLTRQQKEDLLPSEKAFRARYGRNPMLRTVVSDIDRIETQIESASAPRRQLEELIKQLFSGGKAVTFTDTSIDTKTSLGKEIGLAALSSGEKHLLLILVETLIARDSSIIIDEPEISMHIDWQRQLVQTMRLLSPEAQIIMATHSPEIMCDIPDANIIRM
jgi:predicted ATP-dependent endonuclease of OLD family